MMTRSLCRNKTWPFSLVLVLQSQSRAEPARSVSAARLGVAGGSGGTLLAKHSKQTLKHP
jgi:hypothetical protein